MSLVGIDVGTSAIKVGVYDDAGRRLALCWSAVKPASPGSEGVEVDPQFVWAAVQDALMQIAAVKAVRRDPPRALAISASGDEVFPTDAAANALGPCIMSADRRGAEIETATLAHATPSSWYRLCGHVPERMDPTNRLLWWRSRRPETAARAARFLGWHEFLTQKLCGRAVTDPSLASKWAVFDRTTGQWSPNRLASFGLAPELLPEVGRWGESVGTLIPELAAKLGLPRDLQVTVGAFDSVCTALGIGVCEPGVAGLACGTWEVLAVPSSINEPNLKIVDARLPIVKYPGARQEVVLWQSPNGASVAEWAARLIGQPIEVAGMLEHSQPVGEIIAVPHLFGSVGLWPEARECRGAILGISASTTPKDVLAAFLEAVAMDLALAVRAIDTANAPVQSLRAGGGAPDRHGGCNARPT
jgi:sugar (pentulose or hexulose) kinase